jgi:hypothetical protein
MHECGLAYVASGERIGSEERQRQSEKLASQRQLQQIANQPLV